MSICSNNSTTRVSGYWLKVIVDPTLFHTTLLSPKTRGFVHVPVLILVLLKELLDLFRLELPLVLIVLLNGLHLIDGVLLLGQKLLE